MNEFTAILLICLLGTPVDRCNEATAVDVLSHGVSNEMQCAFGWQELAAHLAEGQDIGTATYVRTLCRRTQHAAVQFPVASRERD